MEADLVEVFFDRQICNWKHGLTLVILRLKDTGLRQMMCKLAWEILNCIVADVRGRMAARSKLKKSILNCTLCYMWRIPYSVLA